MFFIFFTCFRLFICWCIFRSKCKGFLYFLYVIYVIYVSVVVSKEVNICVIEVHDGMFNLFFTYFRLYLLV